MAAAGAQPAQAGCRQPLLGVKLVVAAVGHRMPAWVRDGFDDYASRMPRESRLKLVEIKPALRRDAHPETVRRALEVEHERIVAALPQRCHSVVLDEQGVDLSTLELVERMTGWRAAGRDVAFAIGGADGTAPALKKEADFVWSLSRLTLPHGLVRVMLAEQLYRAASILSGHPYHRA